MDIKTGKLHSHAHAHAAVHFVAEYKECCEDEVEESAC